VKKDLDPTDVMLQGVGMRDLFTDAHLDLELFSRLDCIRALDDGRVFFCLPVGRLDFISDTHG
jgi:hypothetical protein